MHRHLRSQCPHTAACVLLSADVFCKLRNVVASLKGRSRDGDGDAVFSGGDDDVPMLGNSPEFELADVVGRSASEGGVGGGDGGGGGAAAAAGNGGGGGSINRSASDNSPSRPIRRRNRRSMASTTGGVSRAVKRWQLYYTLIRNPELIELRAHHGSWDEAKQRLSLRPRGKSFLNGIEGGG